MCLLVRKKSLKESLAGLKLERIKLLWGLLFQNKKRGYKKVLSVYFVTKFWISLFFKCHNFTCILIEIVNKILSVFWFIHCEHTHKNVYWVCINTEVGKPMCWEMETLGKITTIKCVHKFCTEMTTVAFNWLFTLSRNHQLQILLFQRPKKYLLTVKDTFII